MKTLKKLWILVIALFIGGCMERIEVTTGALSEVRDKAELACSLFGGVDKDHMVLRQYASNKVHVITSCKNGLEVDFDVDVKEGTENDAT